MIVRSFGLWAALLLCSGQAQADTCPLEFLYGPTINVEMARTDAEMHRGLSGRTADQPHAMLFMWQTAEPRVFWMKDTDQDLDVGFIGATLRLDQILHMKANTTTYHYSASPAIWAVELPAGEFERLGLHTGMYLSPRGCMERF